LSTTAVKIGLLPYSFPTLPPGVVGDLDSLWKANVVEKIDVAWVGAKGVEHGPKFQ
jgi:hypothetical protein